MEPTVGPVEIEYPNAEGSLLRRIGTFKECLSIKVVRVIKGSTKSQGLQLQKPSMESLRSPTTSLPSALPYPGKVKKETTPTELYTKKNPVDLHENSETLRNEKQVLAKQAQAASGMTQEKEENKFDLKSMFTS